MIEKAATNSSSFVKDLSSKQGGEMNLRCLNFHEKGHLSKSCPEVKRKPAHRVVVEKSDRKNSDVSASKIDV